MKRLIVEMPDAEMQALERLAKLRSRDPADLLKEQAATMLKIHKVKSITSWDGPYTAGAEYSAKTYPRRALVLAAAVNERARVVLSTPLECMYANSYGLASHPKQVTKCEYVKRPSQARAPTAALQQETVDPDRERRLAVLRRSFGMTKNSPDFPRDGLQYQRKVRAEWE